MSSHCYLTNHHARCSARWLAMSIGSLLVAHAVAAWLSPMALGQPAVNPRTAPGPANLVTQAAELIPGLPPQTIVLPPPGATPDGFTAEITGMEPGFGQLPVRVVIRPTAAVFVEDRELRFRYLPGSVFPSGGGAEFEFSIRLQRGEQQAEHVAYCPKWFVADQVSVEIWEHGQRLPAYTHHFRSAVRGSIFHNHFGSVEATMIESAIKRIGWIAAPGSPPLASVTTIDQIPDLRALLLTTQPLQIEPYPLGQPTALLTVLPLLQQSGGFHFSTINQLPTHWLAMDRCNIWVTQWSTWQAIQQRKPAAAAAMQQYLRCGGVLWLLDAPPTADVAAAFSLRYPQGIPPSDEATVPSISSDEVIQFAQPYFPQQLHWMLLQPSRSQSGLVHAPPSAGRTAGPVAVSQMLDQWHSHVVRASDFATLDIGAGRIVCCSLDDPFPGSYHLWHQMEILSGAASVPVINHRLDPVLGDWRFWAWAIPGVAQPPVYTFIGLLAVFVLLVGPLAYRLLNRYGRGYLIFFVAPLLALGTTLILLVYGVLADGLGTRARIRQVTWVCDEAGGAVRYWRSTYFAGRQIRSDLRFPADTRLQPYRVPSGASQFYPASGGTSVSGTIHLTETDLLLSHSFLPARTQAQFVAHRPMDFAQSIVWDHADSGQSPTVRNRFDFPIAELVVCDRQGDYWLGGPVEGGGQVVLQPLDEPQRRELFSQWYRREPLQMPAGVVPPRRYGYSSNDWLTSLTSSVPMAQVAAGASPQADGVIENWLAQHLELQAALPPGMYVAIAPVTDDCLAVSGTKLSHSIHFVIGELP